MGRKHNEVFIERADNLNARVGAGALLDTDNLLEVQGWLEECDTSANFYLAYCDVLSRVLQFMLTNPDEQDPPLLGVLLTADLERHFSPIDLAGARYGHVMALIKYAMARVVAEELSGSRAPHEWQERVDLAVKTLWELPSAEKMEDREMLRAVETLLDVAFGRFEKVIEKFERDLRFPLEKLENAARTLVKQCYLLSQIALGLGDEDTPFGARSYAVLLKYDYYRWRVDEDIEARIDFLPVFLASWLNERIAAGKSPALREVLQSMSPRAVIAEMEAIRLP